MKLIVLLIALFAFSTQSYSAEKPSLPAVLKADKIDGDKNTNIVNATGNVELKKENNILYTDKLSYDKNTQNISATGNIKIKNYDIGNVLAKTADVKSDFKTGQFNDATIIFNDGSYIKSPTITRINESETIFKTPTFSICPNDEVKDDNFLAGKETDPISITSTQTVIDRSTNSVKTKNGVIRLYDFPIFYTPYLKNAIPSSKRKTGFLHPSYVNSTRLGAGFKIPYYFNIAPDKDLTTTLQYHPSEGHLILDNNYRQLTKYGSYGVDLELANNKPKTNNLLGSEESNQNLRWRLKSKGDFKLPDNLGLNFKIDNLGDKNYLRDYGNQFDGYTLSEVNLDYIKDKDYGSIKTVKIQELEVSLDEREAPTALPIINYYTERKPQNSWFNQTYSLLTNSTIITRRSGLQYRRVSLKPEIRVPYNLKGNLFELSSSVQSDFYNMEDNFIDSRQNNNFNSTATNYRPEVNFKWSLPMVTKHNNNTLVLEPLATLTSSSYTNGNRNIANEDSINTELTQGNLFLSDRLTGFDRNEAGQRMSYGFKSSLFGDYGQFNLGLGQSWRRSPITQDVVIRGFANNNKSNIVGEFGYKTSKIFSIYYNFQLNESSYSNDINEITTRFDFERVRIGSNYIFLRKTINNLEEREQIDLNFSANITKELVFDANTTHDLITNRKIYSKYSLTHNGCCISYGISYGENNPTALSRAEKSYNINFAIKNL